MGKWKELAQLDDIHTCHSECQNPLCVAVRQAVAEEREAFKAELDKEDLECLDDEAFNIVFGLQEWLKTRGQK